MEYSNRITVLMSHVPLFGVSGWRWTPWPLDWVHTSARDQRKCQVNACMIYWLTLFMKSQLSLGFTENYAKKAESSTHSSTWGIKCLADVRGQSGQAGWFCRTHKTELPTLKLIAFPILKLPLNKLSSCHVLRLSSKLCSPPAVCNMLTGTERLPLDQLISYLS